MTLPRFNFEGSPDDSDVVGAAVAELDEAAI
jgi:hypothetical protein